MNIGIRQLAVGNRNKGKLFHVALCAILFAACFSAQAQQQPAPVRICWLSAGGGADHSALDAFRDGMRDLGYVEGRNLVIDARWGDGSNQRLNRYAVELVSSMPKALVTQAGQAIFAVRRTKPEIPIVFGLSGDPVEAGLVASFAHPGGYFTGVSFLSLELVGKRMELLKETIVTLKRVAVLANPGHPGEKSEQRETRAAAKALGLDVEYFPASPGPAYDSVLPEVVKSRSQALFVFPDAGVIGNSEKIAAFSVKNRIPAMSGWAEFAERGNLMTYGPILNEGYRRLATYVDKILRGAKPMNLPVELPKKFELVINLKAAKQIGLAIPPNVLARADRVIR
jgi:putative ABC transport system substrate-binding protein